MAYQFKNVFNCQKPEKINKIVFSIAYRNNFVGYLNGEEIIRKEPLSLTETFYEEINLSAYRTKLQQGSNEFLIELQQIPTGLLETDTLTDEHLLFNAEIFLI